MLETQRYLRAGGTLDDLAARYAIKARIADDLGVVCLNYAQGLSPMSEVICRECRSLILELGTWNVVARSFFKFFNHGQREADVIDWSTARVLEKLDGSLITLYHWRGAWHFATRAVADGAGPAGDGRLTFRKLIDLTLHDMGLTLDTLTAFADPDVSYSFELTAPENRVIVEQDRRLLTLIGAWDRNTLDELDPSTVSLPGIDWVRQYDLNVAGPNELRELAARFEPTEAEGYVVVDAAFRRVKIKNPLYVAASGYLGGLITTKQQLTLLLDPGFDDVVPILEPSTRARMEAVERRFAEMTSAIIADYATIAHIETQRDFAAEALKRRHSKLLFDLRKGVAIDDCVRSIHLDSLVGLFDAYAGQAA